MKDGPSSSKAFGELYSSAKNFLKALFRDLLRLPNLLLVDRKKYQEELRQRNEEIASLKEKLEASETKPSERDQYFKELQQYINELQLKNEEIVALKEGLKDSDDHQAEIREYLEELKQSREEIVSLKEKLEVNEVKEIEIRQSSTSEVSKSFKDRMTKMLSVQFGEASIRKDSYQLLQQIVLVIADLEDAGDALSDAYDQYRTGRRNYAGGAPVGQLVSAVISFNKIWSQTKEAIQPLLDEQASMKPLPKESDGKNS